MPQTQLIVHGVNYEGAHFRGYESPTDEWLVKVEVHGEEQQVVDFILDNFSYGNEFEGIETVEELCESLIVRDTPIFDGCGAALKLQYVGQTKPELNIINDYLQAEEDQWVDLGIVNVDNEEVNHNTVNNLVRRKFSNESP